MAISPQPVVRSISCLVLGWGFGGWQIERRYLRFEQIQDGGRRHVGKISNGHIRPYPERWSWTFKFVPTRVGLKDFFAYHCLRPKYCKIESSPSEFVSILRKNPLNCALFFIAVWSPVAKFPPIRWSLLRSNSEVGQDNYVVTMVAM